MYSAITNEIINILRNKNLSLILQFEIYDIKILIQV